MISEAVLSALGGIGLFWFGIYLVSQNLQLIFDRLIRKTMNSLSGSRIGALFVGLIVAVLLQSSSVTSVMVISFTNAGLMNLLQGLSVILGINLGSSLTALLVSAPVGNGQFLFFAIGILVLFILRFEKLLYFGRLFLALGMMFLGISILSDALVAKKFATLTLLMSQMSLPVLFLVTMLATFVFRSGISVFVIVMTAYSGGIVSILAAVAMVLGLNVGSTWSAVLASAKTNVSSRRVAGFHFLVNLFMAVIGLVYIEEIAGALIAIYQLTGSVLGGWLGLIPLAHLLLNIGTVLIALPALPLFVRFIKFLIPEKEKKEPNKLEYLGSPGHLAPTLAIELGYQELKKLAAMVQTLMSLKKDYISGSQHQEEVIKRIRKYENITDNIQSEMAVFLSAVMEGQLTSRQSREVKTMLKLTDEFESIANLCESIVEYRKKLFEENIEVKSEALNFLDLFSDLLMEQFDFVFNGFAGGMKFDDEGYNHSLEKFNSMANDMGGFYFRSVNEAKLTLPEGLAMNEISVNMKEIRNHICKIRSFLWK